MGTQPDSPPGKGIWQHLHRENEGYLFDGGRLQLAQQAHFRQTNIPAEQFAKAGTQAAHGVLCKILFCDMVRALHITAGLPSVDLGNCYDAVAHPIASIAMQALKVPVLTIVLSLSVLQTMTFYLRTGYTESVRRVTEARLMIPRMDLAKATEWLRLGSQASAH